jgi:hypothetical protein
MSTWNTETALQEIEQLIKEIDLLYNQRRGSAAHTRWFIRAMTFLQEVFGENSVFFGAFAATKWGHVGGFILTGYETLEPEQAIEQRRQQAYRYQLENTIGLFQAAADQLRRKGIEAVYEGKDTGPEASIIVKVINLAERKLRKVMRDVPAKEKEVQDAFESLLIGADISFSRETDSIEYSSKTYTPDFTIAKADLAIEIKLCRKVEREKEMIAEINDDILAYRSKYGNCLFVIYDCGFIRDVERFARNFEQNENVIVKVVKH